MFDAIINKRGDLLIIHFSDTVDRNQSGQCVDLVRSLIGKAKPGFTVITDLGRLKNMDFDCAKDVAILMDLCSKAQVAKVHRVIPNPDVDIGWNILSKFHYNSEKVKINTYRSFYLAIKDLIEMEA